MRQSSFNRQALCKSAPFYIMAWGIRWLSVSQGLRTNAPRRPTAVLLPGGFPRIFCYGAHPNPLLFCCKTRPSPRMRVPGILCVHKYRIWSVSFILALEEIFAQCSKSLARTKDLHHNRMLLGAHFE